MLMTQTRSCAYKTTRSYGNGNAIIIQNLLQLEPTPQPLQVPRNLSAGFPHFRSSLAASSRAFRISQALSHTSRQFTQVDTHVTHRVQDMPPLALNGKS
jgi:hypothetical protein